MPRAGLASGCLPDLDQHEIELLGGLLGEVTRRQVTRSDLPEERLFLVTNGLGERAAGMKAAAGRRIDRAGNLAPEWHVRVELGQTRIGDRHGREEGLS